MKFQGSFDKKNKKLSYAPSIVLKQDSLLLNGRIYNYFQLMKEYALSNDSRTESEVLLRLLKLKGLKALLLLNANYAIAYKKNDKLFLITDLIGSIPIYYSDNEDSFKFKDQEFKDSKKLGKGTTLELNLNNGNIKIKDKIEIQSFEKIKDFEESVQEYAKQLFRSISSRVYNLKEFAIHDNNSLETYVIVKICKDLDCDYETFKGSLSKACQKARKQGYNEIITDKTKTDYELSRKTGIEIRYPFLDIKLLQTSMRLENKNKVLKIIAQNLH